jgi:OOP family OmpA-OmpF porin
MGVRSSLAKARRSGPIPCLLAVLVAGCAAAGAHPALEQADFAVERARSSPRVRALAPAELNLAEIALEQAGAAARAGAPPAQVEHLAYVASQRAALAEARAAAEVARSETELLRRTLGQAAFEAPAEDRQKGQRPQEAKQAGAPLEEDQGPRALAEDRITGAAEPDPVVADVETTARELSLRLAQLPFQDAEPTEQALEQLAALAKRLAHEPGLSLLLEADFDLPEPAARTLMERRVEVVRAFFLERGVAPARLIVRAGGDSPAQPQATSAFVAAPE